MKKLLFLATIMLLCPLSSATNNQETHTAVLGDPQKMYSTTEYIDMVGVGEANGDKYNLLSDSRYAKLYIKYEYLEEGDEDFTSEGVVESEQAYLELNISGYSDCEYIFAYHEDSKKYVNQMTTLYYETNGTNYSLPVEYNEGWNYVKFSTNKFKIPITLTVHDLVANDFNLKWMCYVAYTGESDVLPCDDFFEDNKAPTISGPDVIYKGTLFTLTFDDILSLYKADERIEKWEIHDGNAYGQGLYEGNGNKDGDYVLRVTATDLSGNIAVKPVVIKVYEELAPIMILDTSKIIVYNDIKLDINDFIQILKTTKLVDVKYDNSYIVVEDDYTNAHMSTGKHKLIILVKSSSGNSFQHEFNIEVLKSPNAIVDNYQNSWVDDTFDFFENIWLWIWDNVFKPVFKLFGYEDR